MIPLLGNTFWQCQKIVVPLSIRVGSDILAGRPIDNSNISPCSADKRIESVCSALNRFNNLLPRPIPAVSAKVCDTMVGVLAGLLANTKNTHVCHKSDPFCRTNPSRFSGKQTPAYFDKIVNQYAHACIAFTVEGGSGTEKCLAD
jgi:hypothetical protein